MSRAKTKMSKELKELIEAIGDCRSKQEENKIMRNEIETLKSLVSKTKSTPNDKREYLIRAIYLDMLGHDTSFIHLHAVNLTQDKNILNKRVGYLACSIFLHEQSEFIILLISSIQKDLQSQNWLEVSMALTAIARFANPLIIQAVSEPILKLLDSRDERIRKKAAMCLYKFYQVDKNAIMDCEHKISNLLCDKDPSVVAATLPFYREMAEKETEKLKPLVDTFVLIFKQVVEGKFGNLYNYHRFPAPWVQNYILEILSYLGKDDQNCSAKMYEAIELCINKADKVGNNIGYATVYQCVKTICTIYPNSNLIKSASNIIAKFLSSDSPNLRCTGIYGLTLIIQFDQNYVMNFQSIIVDCMEINDETLKRATFELLYRMASLKNVEVIVDKMMNYLRKTTLEIPSKKEILQKIIELTERYAPNKAWFIKIINDVFLNFGSMVTDTVLLKLINIMSEWEQEAEDINEFKKYTIENYASVVETYSILSDSFVKFMAWIAGEYTNKLYMNDEEKIKGILEMLCYLLNKNYDDKITKCYLISAILKIHSNINYLELSFINDVIEKYSHSKIPEIQQRCFEYQRAKSQFYKIEISNQQNFAIDTELSFLSEYARNKSGGKIYNPEMFDMFWDRFCAVDTKLNVKSYQVQSSVLSMPGKHENMNKLYDEEKNFIATDLKGELNVKADKKWGAEGYKDENKKDIAKKWGNNYVDNYIGIGSENNNNNKQDVPKDISTNINSSKTHQNKKKEEEFDVQKKKLMDDLFKGMQTDDKKQKKNNKSNKNDQKNNTNDKNKNIFNLFDGLTQNTKDNSIQETNKTTVNSNNQNNNNDNSLNIFNDMFVSNETDNNINLAPPQAIKVNNTILEKNYYTPYNIDEETFGQMWESYPDEDSFDIPINIGSPQKFQEIIKSKGNFAAVSIIENEAISAAIYKNQYALVYAEINTNIVNLRVKCQNIQLKKEVGHFVMGLFQ